MIRNRFFESGGFLEGKTWRSHALIILWTRNLLEELINTQSFSTYSVLYEICSSLQCSQEPTTAPYHEADESSTHLHILLL
jgi:hypothetical protein